MELRDDIAQFVVDRLKHSEDGKPGLLFKLIAKAILHRESTYATKRRKRPFNREEWISSLDLAASHQVIRDLCDELDESFVFDISLIRATVEIVAFSRKSQAIKAANARLALSPKQKAKAEAFSLWLAWQTGTDRYRSGAAFARHIVDTLPITVERWIKQWRNSQMAQT